MAYIAPTTTWRLPKGKSRATAIRAMWLPPMFAGWKPCAGQALWSVWPKGYGRFRMTCPSVAASTTHSAWVEWRWS
ncbi:hypothetical protein D9M71_490040 [compost metagenome]